MSQLLLGPYEPVGPPPSGWGADHLTRFIDSAYVNRFATFFRKRAQFDQLSAIDRLFCAVATNWQNPEDPLTPHLFLRAHAAFLAAAEHAAGGQVGETYALARLALEYGGYAVLIKRRPELARLWLKRQDGVAARKAVRKEFSAATAENALRVLDPRSAQDFRRLYDLTIDMGAHPNELAITTATKIVEFDGGKHMLQAYLHRDGPEIDHAIATARDSGACVLRMGRHLFPDRYLGLGIGPALDALA